MIPTRTIISEQDIKRQLEAIHQLPFCMPEKEMLERILSCLDLTTLEGSDNYTKVHSLCLQAKSYEVHGLSNVAAVCVYPNFAAQVSEELKDTGIKTACVAGSFPSGQGFLDLRLAEVRRAVALGADEIDMVISRGRYLDGDSQYIFEEIAQHKEACGNAHLKVILETGELKDASAIMHVSEIAIAAGADFIKTSTGKIAPAATEEAFYVMLLAIKKKYEQDGRQIGIKPAGGISEPEVAIRYLHILTHVLGEGWAQKNLFRIGASRLANKIAAILQA